MPPEENTQTTEENKDTSLGQGTEESGTVDNAQNDEQSGTDENQGTEGNNEENEAGQGDDNQEGGQEPKKPSRSKRRFDRERQARIAAEERLRAYEETNGINRQQQTQDEPEKRFKEPNPNDYEHGINDINFINDRADFVARKAYYEEKERDTQYQQQQKMQQTIHQADRNFRQKCDSAAEKYEDFDEVFESNRVDMPPAVLHALKTSEHAGDLAYQILKDPKLGDKFSQMEPIAAIRELGRMEAKLTPTQQKQGNKASKFTKPFKPVGSGKSTNASRQWRDDISDNEFEEEFPYSDLN